MFTTAIEKIEDKLLIYMSRNSRVFTTRKNLLLSFFVIYMSRNSRVFTTRVRSGVTF